MNSKKQLTFSKNVSYVSETTSYVKTTLLKPKSV